MRSRPAGPGWRAAAAGLAVLILSAVSPAQAQGPGGLELAVKATYLYKLAPFVSWPPTAYAAPNAPLVICVQGQDPFGPLLDRATSGQAVGTHPVVVRRLARLDADSGCQIAYVAGGPAQSQAQALEAVEDAPVLTVTDEARGKGARGIVHLLLESGRVRFSIDAGKAEAGGVAISSKLLALAVAVKR
ncbi:YfiR family protein [Phenylobacterium sp.]|uniref:YfiR family protein n=1 Tax=Phenylobacterium sp. TaxID=1871053 RepID=UPI00356818C7